WYAALDRPGFGNPARHATVEHRHPLVSEVAQQPPQPRRGRAIAEVIGDDVRARTDAGARHRRGEVRGSGQRMAPGTLPAGCGKLAVDIEEDRAGNVRLSIRRAPLLLL